MATSTETAQALRRAYRIAACAGTAFVEVVVSVILVPLAERVHAAHRDVARSSGVSEGVRGGAGVLRWIDVERDPPQLCRAKLCKLGEAKVRSFVAER
jgi:hypothetical protein